MKAALYRALSLGAGVQSTTLLLMAAGGEFPGAEPQVAIFADTGWEPALVYQNLAWLERTVGPIIPIERVSNGNLRQAVCALGHAPTTHCPSPPFYIKGERGLGRLKRGCTYDYKIVPIRRRLRQLAPRQPVEMWLGISLDEALRMKDSGVKWLTNRWPLVERRMTRWDCIMWLHKHGYPVPGKSACIGCPFHRDKEWREMRDARPAEWADALEVDAAIRRSIPHIRAEVFMHHSCKPLAEVDLSTPQDAGQLELPWVEECTGLCGV